jgi:hypothetical protein
MPAPQENFGDFFLEGMRTPIEECATKEELDW